MSPNGLNIITLYTAMTFFTELVKKLKLYNNKKFDVSYTILGGNTVDEILRPLGHFSLISRFWFLYAGKT